MLANSRSQEIDSHLQVCAPCRAAYDEARELSSMLRNLPVVEAREGFFRDAMQVAREKNRPAASQGPWRRPFTGAIAASLVLMATVSLWQGGETAPTIANVEVALNQVKNLDLVFSSPTDIRDVSFTMTLSDNLALAKYPDRKQLEWKTDLKKGTNRLSLPVMALAEGEGVIHAVMRDGKKEKVFRMVVRVGPSGISYRNLPDGLDV